MEKKIYLKYYIGCDVQTPSGIGKLNYVSAIDESAGVTYGAMGPDFDNVYRIEQVKPILRPLSDMREEEAFELFKIQIGEYHFSEAEYKLVWQGYGYTENDLQVHDSVKCFRIDWYCKHPNVMNWLPSTLLQLDDEDSSVIWGQFSDAGKELKDDLTDNAAQQFHWLLSRGFDLFSLIPKNLAIEKTKDI